MDESRGLRVGGRGGGAASERWVPALLRAGAWLATWVLLVYFIPDRLVAYLSTRVGPDVRDVLVLLWVLVWFVFLCWLFVVLQLGRPRERA